MNWIAKKRHWWDLNCDSDPNTSSLSFYQTLERISTYFELHDYETEMPIFGVPLDATKSSELLILSLTEKGLAPAVAKARIASYNGAGLIYQWLVSAVFACHVFSKPRIANTKAALTRQKLKFLLIWMPILILVIFG